MTNTNVKKQFFAADIYKFICALLVASIHTQLMMDINEPIGFFIVKILSRLAVPSFFVLSGFFFFRKITFHCGKIKNCKENIHKLFTYEKRIIILYLIWTVIYLQLRCLDEFKNGKLSLHTFIDFLLQLYFKGHITIFGILFR